MEFTREQIKTVMTDSTTGAGSGEARKPSAFIFSCRSRASIIDCHRDMWQVREISSPMELKNTLNVR